MPLNNKTNKQICIRKNDHIDAISITLSMMLRFHELISHHKKYSLVLQI